MTKPRLLLDVDGILADFVSASLPAINRIMGTNYVHDDVTQYDMESQFGMNADQRIALRQAWGKRGFCWDIPVYPGAVEGVRQLMELGDVYPVTAPLTVCETWACERERWLFVKFGIDSHRVIHTSAKYMIDGDVLIEDKLSNMTAWQKDHPNGLGLLWDRPYNQGLRAGDDFRVRTWGDVVDLVKLKRMG